MHLVHVRCEHQPQLQFQGVGQASLTTRDSTGTHAGEERCRSSPWGEKQRGCLAEGL